MMARIIVFPELGVREDWGEFEFVALPSVEDRVSAVHDGALRHLSVLEIFHLPRNPRAPNEQPEVRIVAAPRRKPA